MRVILILTSVIFAAESQSMCIWGAASTNQMLNGEYTYGCCIGGDSYYRMVVDSSCAINGKSTFYLYRYLDSYWFIGHTVGSTDVFALCSSTSVSPTDCNGKWSSGFGTSTVQTTSGSCPQLNCGVITTTFSSNNRCQTAFNQKIGVNQWKGYNQLYQQNVYFYFAPQLFKWICNDHVSDTCNVNNNNVYYDKSEAQWNTLYQGSSINLLFDSGSVQTINCLAPTKYPTSNPTTINPTTSQPSQSPTYEPTFDPSNDPTTEPTNKPTYYPSTVPTQNPTSVPTLEPTTFEPTQLTQPPTTSQPSTNPSTFEPTTIQPTKVNVNDSNHTVIYNINIHVICVLLCFKMLF